jgi:hypothetical protein
MPREVKFALTVEFRKTHDGILAIRCRNALNLEEKGVHLGERIIVKRARACNSSIVACASELASLAVPERIRVVTVTRPQKATSTHRSGYGTA